jgi:myo-inositol-1-phosphate synthase
MGCGLKPPKRGEKLAVLLPGMGAVATTAVAGVEAVRKRLAAPVGSLTQLGYLQGADGARGPLVREAVPLAPLEDLVFGGWDPFPDDAYRAAVRANVLRREHLEPLRAELEAVRPMPDRT